MYTASSGRWRCLLADGVVHRIVRGGVQSPTPETDLPLSDDRRLHRHTADLVVVDGALRLVNRGTRNSLIVHDLARVGALVVDPGHTVQLPWHSCRIDIDLGDHVESIRLDAEAGETVYLESALVAGGEQTVRPVQLSRSAGYFTALVVICEPRLLDPTSMAIPTDAQIAARINLAGIEPSRITAKTVEKRLEYCRVKLGLRAAPDHAGAGSEDRGARRRLVELVLLNRLVTADDLALLNGSD